MKKDETTVEVQDTRDEVPEKQTEQTKDDSEFKVTVRKLEVPVRPRGVLAE